MGFGDTPAGSFDGGKLHRFTLELPKGWKPRTMRDAKMLSDDLLIYGSAYATEDGRRIDPRTVTVEDGVARTLAHGTQLEMRAYALHRQLNIAMPSAMAATEAADLTERYPRLLFDGIELRRDGPTWFGRYDVRDPDDPLSTDGLPAEHRTTTTGLLLVELDESTAFLRQLHAEGEIDEGDLHELQTTVKAWHEPTGRIDLAEPDEIPEELRRLWLERGRCDHVDGGVLCAGVKNHLGPHVIVDPERSEPGKPTMKYLTKPRCASPGKPPIPEQTHPVGRAAARDAHAQLRAARRDRVRRRRHRRDRPHLVGLVMGDGLMEIKVPPPPPGKRFMLIPFDAQLADKIAEAIPNGLVETELLRRLEETAREYLQTRPIDIHLG
jgi:hypothetical protein